MNSRIKELDYLKCIFIVLMIVFHLVYIGDMYPYTKKIVYTFHMSAFLIISGYLANITKTKSKFYHTIIWIFIPYAILEIGYVFMSFLLPVREKVEELSLSIFLNKVFISPMGPYWYLHTLITCSIFYYVIYNACGKFSNISRFIILGLCLFGISYFFKLVSFGNAMYFMMGVALCQSRINFIQVFQASLFSIFPIVILCSFPENLDRSTFAGVVITYLSISFLLYIHKFIPCRLERLFRYIGQHTLIILLFSPIFTILSKLMLPFLTFDHSGIIYMCIATCFTIIGCFIIAQIMDWLKLSKYFFGRDRMLYYL